MEIELVIKKSRFIETLTLITVSVIPRQKEKIFFQGSRYSVVDVVHDFDNEKIKVIAVLDEVSSAY